MELFLTQEAQEAQEAQRFRLTHSDKLSVRVLFLTFHAKGARGAKISFDT
jgi:hypothetical protein